jgi:hypothetical protein
MLLRLSRHKACSYTNLYCFRRATGSLKIRKGTPVCLHKVSFLFYLSSRFTLVYTNSNLAPAHAGKRHTLDKVTLEQDKDNDNGSHYDKAGSHHMCPIGRTARRELELSQCQL